MILSKFCFNLEEGAAIISPEPMAVQNHDAAKRRKDDPQKKETVGKEYSKSE